MSKSKTNTVIATWQQGVKEVLVGTMIEFDDRTICVAPAKVIEFVESLGWKHKKPEEGGMLSTNGWDYDWWLDFVKSGQKSFSASGSGFYGGFIFEETENS